MIRRMSFDDLIIDIAVQFCRSAGAALIEQDDVPCAPNIVEGMCKHRIKLDGGLARAPGDRYERVGLRLQAQGRYDRDTEGKQGRGRIRGVNVSFERATASFNSRKTLTAADTTFLENEFGVGRRRGGDTAQTKRGWQS